MMNRTTLPCALRLDIHQPSVIISYLSHRSLGSTLIKSVLIMFALAATPAIRAQTCENSGDRGMESISASIKIKDTNIAVTEGTIVPAGAILQIDSVATATGSCTTRAWDGSSCVITGFGNRVPNHTQVSVDVETTAGTYGGIVGIVWGTGGPDQHVLDTQSADTTGPNNLWVPSPGTYTIHVYANINYTFCNPTPAETETITLTVQVGDNDKATNSGTTSCKSGVAKPINVTNGNMYLQQTDYRLPDFGAGLELTRTYNSQMHRTGLFGFSWSSILDESIKAYNTKLLRLNLAEGRAVYLARSSITTPYVPLQSSDFYGQVVQNVDNSYTLTLKDGQVHQFSATGKLLSFADAKQ